MSVVPCPCGGGLCALDDPVVAMEHGQVFLASPGELQDRWHVDLANFQLGRPVDEKLRQQLDAHVAAWQASADGLAMQVAPLPNELSRFAKAVVVVCQPCGCYHTANY